MAKKALITGITGQDGAYLAQLLLSKGYLVYGIHRPSSLDNTARLKELGILPEVNLVASGLSSVDEICEHLEAIQPAEIYNLAAVSSVAASFENPLLAGDCNGLGAVKLLESIRTVNPKIKYYQASSSEMFGNAKEVPQHEETPFNPQSPYAIAKLYAHQMTANYREAFGLFGCSGILYNHESPLRGLSYVTRKITCAVAKIKNNQAEKLSLGDLEVRRDWGYAPEYVEAMWLMLQQDKPADYVIATGQHHSIGDFVAAAFACVGLNWQDYVVQDPGLYRPTEIKLVVGDAAKAKAKLNWQSRTGFQELVQIMVSADLARLENGGF